MTARTVRVRDGPHRLTGRMTGMDEDGNLLFTTAGDAVQGLALLETVARHRVAS